MMFPAVLSAQQDSIVVERGNTSFASSNNIESEHSAKKAVIMSAVLPGLGQIYNRQAWKVPIIYGVIGGVAYYTYNNYTQMKMYKDEYLYRVDNNDTPNDPELASRPTQNIYNLYEAYNKTFQLSVIVSVAIYGINLLDAYVFGHLFDFQISDDLSLDVSPSLMPGFNSTYGGLSTVFFTPSATLTLRF